MVSFFSGPHGAEEERPEFWQDIPEGSDMLPGLMPGEQQTQDTETQQASVEDALGVGEAPDELKEAGILEGLSDPEFFASEADPLGSWTGVPDPDTDEVPTQDQDDL